MDKAYLVREVKSFLMDEDGVGVIELVLILVVLIGLALPESCSVQMFISLHINSA